MEKSKLTITEILKQAHINETLAKAILGIESINEDILHAVSLINAAQALRRRATKEYKPPTGNLPGSPAAISKRQLGETA